MVMDGGRAGGNWSGVTNQGQVSVEWSTVMGGTLWTVEEEKVEEETDMETLYKCKNWSGVTNQGLVYVEWSIITCGTWWMVEKEDVEEEMDIETLYSCGNWGRETN